MTSPDTPTMPQQLTAPWLTSALRKAGHLCAGAVEHVRAESLDATKAVYGTLVRLSLTYRGASDLPPTMIVKLPSPNPAAAAIMRTRQRERDRDLAPGQTWIDAHDSSTSCPPGSIRARSAAKDKALFLRHCLII